MAEENCSIAVLGMRLEDWVSGNREKRRSLGSLPGFLTGMICGLVEGACWSWRMRYRQELGEGI